MTRRDLSSEEFYLSVCQRQVEGAHTSSFAFQLFRGDIDQRLQHLRLIAIGQ